MKRRIKAAALMMIMLIMILDTGTMLSAMEEGISLCLRSLIPSIFPFMLLSAMLTNYLLGSRLPIIGIIERLLHIPTGLGSIFVIGVLGGYPIGAQCIGVAVETGNLSPADGRRMLCFCSNAGPAFLFGFGVSILGQPILCWFIWLIQLISACMIARLTPGSTGKYHCNLRNNILSIPQIVKKSVNSMASVCGFVLLFRILIGFMSKWMMVLFPPELYTLICGLLELANGCCELNNITSVALRFVLFSVLLSFGGLCVALQISAVTESAGIDTSVYLPAKLTQSCICFVLSSICTHFLFPDEKLFFPVLSLCCVLVAVCYRIYFSCKITKKLVIFN